MGSFWIPAQAGPGQYHPDSTDDTEEFFSSPSSFPAERREASVTQLHILNKMAQNGILGYEMAR